MAVHFPYWIIHGNGDVGKDEKMDEEGRGEGSPNQSGLMSEGEGLRLWHNEDIHFGEW